jgi:Zn-dependent peptidase ImmA (M78 family)
MAGTLGPVGTGAPVTVRTPLTVCREGRFPVGPPGRGRGDGQVDRPRRRQGPTGRATAAKARPGDVEARTAALLAEQGLARVPVPVELLARRVGARVTYEPFEPDVSGLLHQEAGEPPVIGVNSATSANRQRFTIAHELGHLLCGHDGQTLILDRTVQVNWRDRNSGAATDRQEIEANAFEAALLMPAAEVRDRLGSAARGRPVADDELVAWLARTSAVSRHAMEYRLANLGLLSPSG